MEKSHKSELLVKNYVHYLPGLFISIKLGSLFFHQPVLEIALIQSFSKNPAPTKPVGAGIVRGDSSNWEHVITIFL